MKSIVSLARTLHSDEDGAAFIEYTALLGVILAVGLAVLFAVGQWAQGQWNTLNTQLTTGGGGS